MKLTKFALDRPVTVLMAFLGVVLIGLICWQRLSLELLPSINYPQITILTSYENVAPPEIESLVTKLIEEAVGTVKGVRRTTSISKEGTSLVTLDLEWGVDTDLAALDVREKIDLVKDSLPKDVGNPIIVKFDPSSLPIMTLGISGQEDLTELTKIATDVIKQKLERIPGVALARISGAVQREIVVAVDQGRLFAYGIPISDIVDKLEAANFNFPGGKIEKSKNEIRIRTLGQFDNLTDLDKVVVSRGKGKIPIFLRNVSAVQDTFKEQTSSFMIDGKESIGISIFKRADSNTVRVADEVRQVLEDLKKELNPAIKVAVVYNQAVYIRDAIADLQLAAILGGVLAFLVLLLFLRSFRSALIITTAIPISVLGAFILMYSAGITLNLMSLGGVALGVGLLVDNGIVILENIHRHRQKLSNLYDAAIVGTDEMQNPVLASTFAHIIVFIPIIFVKGLAGNLFIQLALTISFALLISILVALILNPMLEARRLSSQQAFSGSPNPSQQRQFFSEHKRWVANAVERMERVVLSPLWRAVDRGMNATEGFYLQMLSLSLKNRKRVILLTLLIFGMSVSLLPLMGRELIPAVDQGSFAIKVTTPPGTTLKATKARTVGIWEILSQEPEIKEVFVNIGYDREEKAEKALGTVEPNEARMTVILREKRSRSVEELVNAVRPKLARVPETELEYILNQDITQLLRQKQKAPEILEIKGPDLEMIEKLTKEVINKLSKINGLKDIKSSLGEAEREIQIHVDREKAASSKLSIKDIADTIKVAMEGEVATKYHDEDEEIDIVVRLRDEDRKEVPDLAKILIHTPLNTEIALSEVAGVSYETRLRQIKRRDQNRISVISANISGTTFSELLGPIETAVKEIHLPSDYFLTVSDEHEEMNRSFRSLMFALLLSVLLVYMLLASLFESILYPFIIMFAVPLAVIGAILILFVTGSSINLGVYIGSIMLGGIVVNNSIILVDYTNRLRQRGIPQQDAILEGGRVRLRPILMTALTTILGLIPLAIGFGKGAEIRTPLAITVIGGLTTSTIMTLIVIPVSYSILEDFKGVLTKTKS